GAAATVMAGDGPPSTPLQPGPYRAFAATPPASAAAAPEVVDRWQGAAHGGAREPAAPLPVIAHLMVAFTAAHRRLYGFAAEDEPIQLVTFRVEASAIVPKATFTAEADAGPDASAAIIGSRSLWLPETGGATDCPVYDRIKLKAGNRLRGPAIVEQMDATTIVLPGWTARVEPFRNLILEAE
ncbi:MAG: hypothetical protein U1E70_29145, partial [Acetobacteraceae bacterium]